MRDQFSGITLNNQRVKAMHRQYQQQPSASSPQRPSRPSPEERMLAMVQSDKIHLFLVEHRANVKRHIGDLKLGFSSLDSINLELEDLKMRKILIEELKVIQDPRSAFPEFVRDVAGLGVNILYPLTRKSRSANMATPARVREYNEWKVLWYNMVDPRNRSWKSRSISASNLASMAKKDLDVWGRKLNIRGRSKMTQRELASAIEMELKK